MVYVLTYISLYGTILYREHLVLFATDTVRYNLYCVAPYRTQEQYFRMAIANENEIFSSSETDTVRTTGITSPIRYCTVPVPYIEL